MKYHYSPHRRKLYTWHRTSFHPRPAKYSRRAFVVSDHFGFLLLLLVGLLLVSVAFWLERGGV